MLPTHVQSAPRVSWAQVAGGNPQRPARFQQQQRPAITNARASQQAASSQKRMHPTPPAKPPGMQFNLGSDASITAAFEQAPKTSIHILNLTLKLDKAGDRNDEPYLKGILDNLQSEAVKAVNAILAYSTDDNIKAPLGPSDVAVSMQKYNTSVQFPIKVKSSLAAKIEFLRDHITYKEAGTLKIQGLPGTKYVPAAICSGRSSNPAALVGFMASMHISPAVAMALIRKAFPGLPVSWIAQLVDNELLNGQGPSGPVDVYLGSSSPITNPDICLLGLIIPDERTYDIVKSGTRDKGGWTFTHDKLKSPSNPSGSVTITLLSRSPVVERDPTPPPAPTKADQEASIDSIHRAHANALILHGLELVKQVPEVKEGDMETQEAEEHKKMTKAAQLATAACSLGNEIVQAATVISSHGKKALASTSSKVVQDEYNALVPLSKDFESKKAALDIMLVDASSLLCDWPVDDIQLGLQSHQEVMPITAAYRTTMRGLRLLLSIVAKVARNHSDPEDDVAIHLTNLKTDKETQKQAKQAKVYAGQSVGGAAPSTSSQ